jgi:hypothetical protein
VVGPHDDSLDHLTYRFVLEAVDEIESELKGEVPSNDNVLQLKYLERVINETLR